MTSSTLPLAHTKPGMRLAADLLDARGATLLAAGSVLSEVLIAALQRHGVQQLDVLTDEAPNEAGLAPRGEAARQRLEYLFRHAGRGEADRLLCEVLLEYRLEHLA